MSTPTSASDAPIFNTKILTQPYHLPFPGLAVPDHTTDSPSPRTVPLPRSHSHRQPTHTPTTLSLSIPSTSALHASAPYATPPISFPTHNRHSSLPTPSSTYRPPYSHAPPTPYSLSSPLQPPTEVPDLSKPPGYTQSRFSFDDLPPSEHPYSSPPQNFRAYYISATHQSSRGKAHHRSRLSILDGEYEIEPRRDEDAVTPLSAGGKWILQKAVALSRVARGLISSPKDNEGDINGNTSRNGDGDRNWDRDGDEEWAGDAEFIERDRFGEEEWLGLGGEGANARDRVVSSDRVLRL